MKVHRAQRGNILFLILLAVILFAALSYAVTSSMKGGGTDASNEKYAAQAASIQQYGTLLANAILRLRLTNNCSDTDIGFYMVDKTSTDYQHSPPAPDRCNVFHPSGGNIPVQRVQDMLNSKVALNYDDFVGRNAIAGHGKDCATADCADLYWVVELPSDINRRKFCEVYNGNNPTRTAGGVWGAPRFNGVYTGSAPPSDLGTSLVTECYIYASDTERHIIYYVLLPR